jgi:hypothetical protein
MLAVLNIAWCRAASRYGSRWVLSAAVAMHVKCRLAPLHWHWSMEHTTKSDCGISEDEKVKHIANRVLAFICSKFLHLFVNLFAPCPSLFVICCTGQQKDRYQKDRSERTLHSPSSKKMQKDIRTQVFRIQESNQGLSGSCYNESGVY